MEGVRDLSGASFIRSLTPSQKLHLLISSPYGLGYQHIIFFRDTNVQSIAMVTFWLGRKGTWKQCLLSSLYIPAHLLVLWLLSVILPEYFFRTGLHVHLISSQNKGHYPTNSKLFKACSSLTPRDFVLRKNSWPKVLSSLLHNSRALEIDAFEASTLYTHLYGLGLFALPTSFKRNPLAITTATIHLSLLSS